MNLLQNFDKIRKNVLNAIYPMNNKHQNIILVDRENKSSSFGLNRVLTKVEMAPTTAHLLSTLQY